MDVCVFMKWFRNFAIYAVLVFLVMEIFEYLVFGSILYFSSAVMGYAVPTAILYSVLLGIVFSVAQCLFVQKSKNCSCCGFSQNHPESYVLGSSHNSSHPRRKKIVSKTRAKKKKRK